MRRRFEPVPQDFAAIFLRFNLDKLKEIARLLKIHPLPTRRGDVEALITTSMADPAVLRRIWESLDTIGQHAVREAAYSDKETFNLRAFKAKYGKVPDIEHGDGFRTPKTTRLSLFIWNMREWIVMPASLKPLLREFVPAPEAATIATCGEQPVPRSADWPLNVFAAEMAAHKDVLAALRLAESDALRVSEKSC